MSSVEIIAIILICLLVYLLLGMFANLFIELSDTELSNKLEDYPRVILLIWIFLIPYAIFQLFVLNYRELQNFFKEIKDFKNSFKK